MPVPCILIMPSRANADSPVELRLQEEGKGTYLSEYANFAAALTEGKIFVVGRFARIWGNNGSCILYGC